MVEITEEEEMNERELERKRDFLGSPGAFALDDYGSGYSNGNSLLTSRQVCQGGHRHHPGH